MEPGQPQVWATYLATDDIERSKEKITAAGGQLLTDVIDIGEHGKMIVAMDVAGAVFGMWQAGTHTGFQLANVAGSVTWNENLSNDVEANKKFYADVCGFNFSDLGDDSHVYATMDIDGKGVAGMTTLPSPDAPPHWITYFAVTDTDATVAKLRELDGTVLQEAFDTPQGRIAIVADNQGAPFGLISVQPED
jgi:predicted enzyme related to lactoylglutathione lyase